MRTGPLAVHLDDVQAVHAWGECYGIRAHQEVVQGHRSIESLRPHVAANLERRWQLRGVHWARFRVDAGQERLVFGDVPDASQIAVSFEDGVERGEARRARMRWVAEVEGMDRDDRIARVRVLPSAVEIMQLCAPQQLAVIEVCNRVAQLHFENIRRHTDRMLRDEITDAQFHDLQIREWDHIAARDERIQKRVRSLIEWWSERQTSGFVVLARSGATSDAWGRS